MYGTLRGKKHSGRNTQTDITLRTIPRQKTEKEHTDGTDGKTERSDGGALGWNANRIEHSNKTFRIEHSGSKGNCAVGLRPVIVRCGAILKGPLLLHSTLLLAMLPSLVPHSVSQEQSEKRGSVPKTLASLYAQQFILQYRLKIQNDWVSRGIDISRDCVGICSH